ncbi:phage tail protein [Streptococcus uberis]|uniref:phage tail protein n=1 Tax=Streptococcus uberis TaxID=1349 RepID=UPI001FF3DDEB|nr:phage tail protein [Streptococcus uberis]MCK1226227.1 phage tail protein [Streptococcus uberis]
MDLLVQKSDQSFTFSEIGLRIIDIDDSSSSLEVDSRTVKGRSGKIFAGSRFGTKKIKVSGRFTVPSIQLFMDKKDIVNGLLVDSEPFYITKMYPTNENIYDFELPGKKSGDLDLLNQPHTAWKYRWKVHITSEPDYNFIGKTSLGLKYNFTMTFETSELPFGETIPKTASSVGGNLSYAGTAPFSQLEYPWTVELTSSGGQSSFYLEVDGRRWTYQHSAPLNSGDVIVMSGIATTLNKINVTARTNHEYFILKPKITKSIKVNTDFLGTIKFLNFMELYK